MPNKARYDVGQSVLLKNGETAKIIGTDPTAKKYNVITDKNQTKQIKPEEIDQLAPDKFQDYQTSGMDKEDEKFLAIQNNSEIQVDRTA